ncbi:MAG: cbb3-type cytochrome oxidase subunit 3 [Rhodothermales bacterium]|jgi:cbb3-type cytochrome oxidase subunit 3
MVRDLLSSIDTGILAQVGLLAFVVAFLAILVYAFTMRPGDRSAAKNMPLTDADDALPTHHS